MSSKKHHRKSTGLNLIAPDHYRNFETIITRNATEYSVRSFEDGVEIFYIDLAQHPVKDWSKVTETLCLMHHISGPVRKPHVNGRKHRRPDADHRPEAESYHRPTVEGGKKVYDLTLTDATEEDLKQAQHFDAAAFMDAVEALPEYGAEA